MKHSISLKLALAFILVAVLTATILSLVFFSTTTSRFQQYVFDQQFYSKLEEVQAFYAEKKSWDGVESLLSPTMMGMGAGSGNGGWQGGGGPGMGGGGFRLTQQAGKESSNTTTSAIGSRQYALADENGLVLVGIENLYPQGTLLDHEQLNEGVPIHDGSKQVGTLLAQRRNVVYTQAEQHFLDRTNTGLLWGLLVTIVLAALIGFLLSRSLTKPVIQLTNAAQKLSSGELNQKVEVRSKDELGELSQAFNQMSAEIENSDRLRKQMTADIAHDLRTPLTVIGGYIESMRDGTLDATPERLNLIYSEINRLNRLVGDLRLLSQSDAGELPVNLQAIDAREVLEQTRDLFELRAQTQDVSMKVSVDPNLPFVLADEARLMQVLENLVGNAIRHTPAGGEIQLNVVRLQASSPQTKDSVRFTVRDSGEGIPTEELGYVFERFHRGDKSRHADENQSGLGLAIVKAIVQAHGGRVWVESEAGKGSQFHFTLKAA